MGSDLESTVFHCSGSQGHPGVSCRSFGTTGNFHDYGNVDRWKEWTAQTRVMEVAPFAKKT